MKKFLLILIFALAAGALFSQQLELKEVIVRSARGIESELPQKAKVAVLNFNSPTKAFSDYVIEELINELLEAGKVTIVDRQNLSAVMNEMKFHYFRYAHRHGKLLPFQDTDHQRRDCGNTKTNNQRIEEGQTSCVFVGRSAGGERSGKKR